MAAQPLHTIPSLIQNQESRAMPVPAQNGNLNLAGNEMVFLGSFAVQYLPSIMGGTIPVSAGNGKIKWQFFRPK